MWIGGRQVCRKAKEKEIKERWTLHLIVAWFEVDVGPISSLTYGTVYACDPHHSASSAYPRPNFTAKESHTPIRSDDLS